MPLRMKKRDATFLVIYSAFLVIRSTLRALLVSRSFFLRRGCFGGGWTFEGAPWVACVWLVGASNPRGGGSEASWTGLCSGAADAPM